MLTEEALEIMLALRQDSEGEWPKFEEGIEPTALTEALRLLMQTPNLISRLRQWCPEFGRHSPSDTEEVFSQLDEYFGHRGFWPEYFAKWRARDLQQDPYCQTPT